MVGTQPEIVAVDAHSGQVAWRCSGPDARGACGRVALGEKVPCIGKALSVVGSDDDAYVVPAHVTLCPVTLALSLGVSMGRSHEKAIAPAS